MSLPAPVLEECVADPGNFNSAPYSKIAEIWGATNFNRLVGIKEKYDPDCLFNRGRVFATKGCIAKKLANTAL